MAQSSDASAAPRGVSGGSLTPREPLIELRTLGRAEAVVGAAGAADARVLGPGKPLALLVWLASMPGRSCTRDQAIDLLWSDMEPEQGRHALRQTIWYLRRRLHDGVIVAKRDSLQLGLEVVSDHAAFLSSTENGRFEQAVFLYRGDFLPDLALPGGVEFEHWAEVERQQIRRAFLHAARAVTRTWIAGGRAREAVTLARQVRDIDASEANWRLVFESLIAARDTVGAALEAEALDRITAEGGGALEPSTRSLMRAATRRTEAATPERARDRGLIAELIGREAEFAAVIAAWDIARTGKAVAVRVVGAAGLGKTRLLNDLAARFRAMRTRVVAVSARPADRHIAYAHAADVAAGLAALKGAAGISQANAAALVDLNPSLSSVFAGARDHRRGEQSALHRIIALRELIGAIADEAPFVMLLDDHHWADQESRRMIAAVIARLEHASVLVVIASRPGYSEIAIDQVRRVELQPLSGANTAALVGSIAELPSEDWAASFTAMLHDVSGGSPLLVLETLHALMERQVLRIEGGAWGTPDRAALLERSGANAIDARVRSSSEDERRVLAVLAVSGAPMTTSLISRTVARREPETAAVLSALETRGLVAGDGARWWPAHDLLSDSFTDLLSVGERHDVERAIADQLMADGAEEASLVRAARHYAAVGAPDRLREAFIAWLALRRQHGDTRSLGTLMSVFSPDVASLRGVWRSVPLQLHFPRWKSIAAGIAILGSTAAGLGWAFRPTTQAPDATVAVWYDSAGVSYEWDVPLHRTMLAANDLLPVSLGMRHATALTPRRTRFSLSPDGTRWVGDETFSDSGGMDIILTDRRLRTERRISSSHDDFGGVWSPDGRMIAFVTGRFNERHWNDIAIFDFATQDVRPITSGPDIDNYPVWNPLGTRIAFSRREPDRQQFQLCVTDLDATLPACIPFPDATQAYPLGWYDERRVVLRLDYPEPDGRQRFVIRMLDPDDPESSRDVYKSYDVAEVTLSPDGKWVACGCIVARTGPPRWTVFPLDDPDIRAEIVRDRTESLPIIVGWVDRRRVNTYLDRLIIADVPATQPLNVPLQLRAYGQRADGRRVDEVPAHWTIQEGDAARIDGDRLVPLRRGRVKLHASAGGWRTADTELTIEPGKATPLATFNWRESLPADWVLFGTPRPAVEPDSLLGRALLTNGDGNFASGILSRAVFPTREGLIIRMRAFMRISDRQWQSLGLSVVEAGESDGDIPAPTDSTGPTDRARSCTLGLPRAEGMSLRNTASILSRNSMEWSALPSLPESGGTRSIGLHVFPDGTCAAIVDGRIVGQTRVPGPPMRRVRIVIMGQMADTRIAVGPLEVLSGTDPAIDWRRPRPDRPR